MEKIIKVENIWKFQASFLFVLNESMLLTLIIVQVCTSMFFFCFFLKIHLF